MATVRNAKSNARQRLEERPERGIAHPVMRPSRAGIYGDHCCGRYEQRAVETRTEFAARIVRRAAIVAQRKVTKVLVRLVKGGRVEPLRLHRCIRGGPAEEGGEAPAALQPSAIALRVEPRVTR